MQLREKQKTKRIYGVLERQFRNIFGRAERMKGVTGANLLGLLERRLDNVVYRSGFVGSRREGRHYVSHGHFLVNGQRVNVPSYTVRPGDVVTLHEGSRANLRINASLASLGSRPVPAWIELDKDQYRSVVKAVPARDQITQTLNEQLIVELYSK